MKKLLLIILFTSIFTNDAFCSRYISLAPSTTEILFSLGLEKEIVGVSSFCNYPKEVSGKEKVGSFSQPNIEKIIFLKPDYVFCTGLEQSIVVEELKRLNIKVYVADPKSFSELLRTISDIGEITNTGQVARQLIDDIENNINDVAKKVRLLPLDKRKKVFIEIWHDPLTTAGEASFVDELITLSGGINIAKNTKRPYSIYSSEQVIAQNPDCIILAYMASKSDKEVVAKRIGWGKINAVKNSQIYNDINPDVLLRPGPRIVQGLKKLHNKLYGE
ncbi:MAG: cobalamin-binding protein [Candidatus Omnitrophota bacterium]